MSASPSALRSTADPTSPTLDDTGWSERGGRRFVSLALARTLAQGAGLVWFVLAARLLDEAEFGRLAVGLTFFAIFAGIGDLGTTRTLARHTATRPTAMTDLLLRAVGIRTVAGITATALAVAALSVVGSPVPAGIVLLAGATATVSGVTELAFTALRGVGAVRTEVWLLVVERVVFLGTAVAFTFRGGGAVGVLVIYLLTNLGSAVASSFAAVRRGRRAGTGDLRFFDHHGRSTAGEFALVTVSPRIGPGVLAVMSLPVVVGVYAAGQRVVEAVALLAVSIAVPVIPMVRHRLLTERRTEAEGTVVVVATSLLSAIAPLAAWAVVRPHQIVDLLFGAGRYPGAAEVLRLLAVVMLTWPLRGVAEMALLAEDRAHTFLRVVAAGCALNLALAVPMVQRQGATGAAGATLVAEVVMTGALLVTLPALVRRAAGLRWAKVAILGALAAAAVAVIGTSTSGSVLVVACGTVVAVALGHRALLGLDTTRPAVAGGPR